MKIMKPLNNSARTSLVAVFAAMFLAIFLSPRASDAAEWEVVYMADTGGSRLWQTDDPAQAIEIVARVFSPDGVALVTSCRPAPPGAHYLTIGQSGEPDGPTFIDHSSQITFIVDSLDPRSASAPEYSQSAYDVLVPNELLREMAAGEQLVMRYGAGPQQRKVFSLRGAHRALNAVNCNPSG